MLSLEDAELLAKQQDFKIFLVLRTPHGGNEVKQEREDASKGEVDHAGDAAWIVPRPGQQRISEPTGNTLEDGHKALDAVFARYRVRHTAPRSLIGVIPAMLALRMGHATAVDLSGSVHGILLPSTVKAGGSRTS